MRKFLLWVALILLVIVEVAIIVNPTLKEVLPVILQLFISFELLIGLLVIMVIIGQLFKK